MIDQYHNHKLVESGKPSNGAIKITGCCDRSMWYSQYLGSVFNIIREYEGDYLVRAGDGFTNFVFKNDAEKVGE